jgi:glycerophosphoryl diester phosphodiesterase
MNRTLLLSALLCLGFVMTSTDADAKKKRVVEVHGHRGARAVLPENTLPALEHALEVGVDWLEFDLGVTKDGHLVLLHDQEVSPILCQRDDGTQLSRPEMVHGLTLKELKALDCGSKQNPRFERQKTVPGADIPTLDEVYELVKRSKAPAAKRVQMNIETKTVPALDRHAPEPADFARLFLEVTKKHGLLDRVVLQSFDHVVLREAKKQEPKLRTSALVEGTRPDFVAMARAIDADFVSPNQHWIEKSDVDALHRAGVKVVPWTANEAKEWQRLVDIGVDAIITDDPKACIAWLKKKRLR